MRSAVVELRDTSDEIVIVNPTYSTERCLGCNREMEVQVLPPPWVALSVDHYCSPCRERLKKG